MSGPKGLFPIIGPKSHYRALYGLPVCQLSPLCPVVAECKMNRFKGLRYEELCIRYEKNEFGLMQDLMLAGLVSSEPPTCQLHDPPATCQLYEKRVWKWRCPRWGCTCTISVVTDDCFLKGLRKYDSLLTIYDLYKHTDNS